MLLERLDESMSDAVAPSDSRDFMHEELPDPAGRSEILDPPQSVPLMIARLSGDRLPANLDNCIAFG
jgi:hypothetical protein